MHHMPLHAVVATVLHVQARISLCVFERNNASTSGAGVQAQESGRVSRRNTKQNELAPCSS
jgi:hypothetical protein